MKTTGRTITGMVLLIVSLFAADKLRKEFRVGLNPELIVDTDVADITVKQGTSGKIKAYIEVPDKERFTIESDQDEDEVRIELKQRTVSGCLFIPLYFMTAEKALITVEVPRNSELDISSDAGRIKLRDVEADGEVQTASGSVTIDDVEGELSLTSSSGWIGVECFSGELAIDVSSGRIELEDVDGEFDIESSSGRVDIAGARGEFRVRTNSGGVDFTGKFSGRGNHITTTTGSIEVVLVNQRDLEIDAHSGTGSVSMDPIPDIYRKVDRHLTATLGRGMNELELRSTTGNIKIINKGFIYPDDTEPIDWDEEDVELPDDAVHPVDDGKVELPDDIIEPVNDDTAGVKLPDDAIHPVDDGKVELPDDAIEPVDEDTSGVKLPDDSQHPVDDGKENLPEGSEHPVESGVKKATLPQDSKQPAEEEEDDENAFSPGGSSE